MIRVFVGYDKRFPLVSHVLTQSIIEHSTRPVSITHIKEEHIRPEFTRKINGDTTAFKYSRFMVPWLCDYNGWAIFMDQDMLVVDDIAKLWALRDERYAVQVVKASYSPRKKKESTYTKGKVNWSSMMLFNCRRCTALSPHMVSEAAYNWLHNFEWCGDDFVGALPDDWNFLVTEYDKAPASLLHFTVIPDGQPWLDVGKQCDYSDTWRTYRDKTIHAQTRFP